MTNYSTTNTKKNKLQTRIFTPKLTDSDTIAFTFLAAEQGLTPDKLIESFVNDIVSSFYNEKITEEEKHLSDWFNSSWFSKDNDGYFSFLQYIIRNKFYKYITALRFLFGYSYYAVETEKRHMDFADIVISTLAEMACAEKTKIQDGYILGRTVIDRLNGLIRSSSFSDCIWSFEEKWESIVAEAKIKNPRSYLKSTLFNWLSDYKLEDFRYAL